MKLNSFLCGDQPQELIDLPPGRLPSTVLTGWFAPGDVGVVLALDRSDGRAVQLLCRGGLGWLLGAWVSRVSAA